MKSYSISFTVGKASNPHGANLEHNNRTFVAENVDPKKILYNIYYANENIQNTYERLFADAVKEYNTKQKQPCRRINNYYNHIKKGKREELFYEAVVQFGDRDTAKIGTQNSEEVKQMLEEYMKDFLKRNPNLYVFNAVLHMDESSPHLHIDFVPFYTKGKVNGLSKGVSMKAALIEQGNVPKSSRENQLVIWEANEREEMKNILERHGLKQHVKNVKTPHLSVEEFKRVKDALKKSIHGFRTLTLEELAGEQGQLLQTKIAVLEGEVEKLNEQKKSPLKNFYYSSEEKCAFVKSKLEEIGATYFETDNGFSVQEYLTDDILEIEKHFKPSENPHREKLKSDIDKIIMQSKNYNDFLQRMTSQGYEVKQGKYLAFKPKFGTRFIRAKSLGEDYSEQALRNRLTSKGRYEYANEKSIAETKNEFELLIYKTVRQYTVIFQDDVLPPKPKNPKKHFSWENSLELDRLLNFSKEVRENNFTLDNLRQNFSDTQKFISETENKISVLKKEIEFYNDLNQKAKLVYENPPTKNLAEKLALEKALKDLTAHKITDRNYSVIEKTAKENRDEIDKLKNILESKLQELKKLSENLSFAEEILGATYVQKLVNIELEKRRSEYICVT